MSLTTLLLCSVFACGASTQDECGTGSVVAAACPSGEAVRRKRDGALLQVSASSSSIVENAASIKGASNDRVEFSAPFPSLVSISGKDIDAVSGGGKKSIFQLKIEDVDNYMFWKILALSLVFTIGVDRLQAYADYKTRDSESGKMLLKRVYGEFVMFGVVAISIFIGNNCVALEQITFSQLEFVDILCSLACCSLIAIVASLFIAFKSVNDKWIDFEEGEEGKADGKPSGTELGPVEYRVIARRFKETHKLPDHFVYSVYLKECFVRDCCDVMNVQWDTWAVFTVLTLGIWILKSSPFAPGLMDVDTYLLLTLFCNLTVFSLHAGLVYYVQQTFNKFLACIPAMAEETSDDKIDHPHEEKWGSRIRWAMQMISLWNTFMLAGYLMHGIHTINVNPVSSLWYFLLVAPVLMKKYVFLTMTTYKLSIIEAFYGSDPEALDAVLTQVCKLDEDMRYVRMLWKYKGEPAPSGGAKDYDLEAFLQALAEDFELHVSEARGRRIFRSFDNNGDGTVTIQEFLDGLKGEQRKSLRRLATDTDLG